MLKRMVICIFSIIFPPVAVMLLTGLNADVFFNCMLFLLAVIPSHIHGFFISSTYFNRKRKVRKGIYPGKPYRLIHSEKVNNGGASRREMDTLRREKDEGQPPKRISNRMSNRVQGWDDGSEKYYEESLSRQSTRRSNRRSRRADDGYAVEQVPSRHSSRRR